MTQETLNRAQKLLNDIKTLSELKSHYQEFRNGLHRVAQGESLSIDVCLDDGCETLHLNVGHADAGLFGALIDVVSSRLNLCEDKINKLEQQLKQL